MAGRSTVTADPAIQAAVDAALASGSTIDEIVAHLRGLGADISRSAVGRYTKQYAALAKEQRDMRTVATAFAKDFGDADDRQGRMMIQLATTLITRTLMPVATGEDPEEVSTKMLADIGRAVKDITSASKIDIEREAKIRDEAVRRAKLEAASAAETELKSAGASEDTMRRVRMGILGMKS